MQQCNILGVRATLKYLPDLPLHHILLPLNFKMLARLYLLCTQVYRKGALSSIHRFENHLEFTPMAPAMLILVTEIWA